MHICTYAYAHIKNSHTHTHAHSSNLNHSQGYQNSYQAHPRDKDSQDALNYRSFSAKEPQIIGLFCGKYTIKIRHPMTLHHPIPDKDAAQWCEDVAHWVV